METKGALGRKIEKIGATAGLSIIVVVSLLLLYSIFSSRKLLYGEFEERIASLAENLADMLGSPLNVISALGDQDVPPEMLSTVHSRLDAVVEKKDIAYAVVLMGGKQIAQANRFGDAKFALPESKAAGGRVSKYALRKARFRNKPLSEIRLPIRKEEETLGEVAFGFDGSSISRKVRNSALISIFLSVIGITVLLRLFRRFLQKTVVLPIESLAVWAEKVSAGDLSQDEFGMRSEDEMGQLAEVFKRMVDTLKYLILQITGSANNVASSSQRLAQISDQAAQTTTHLARVVDRISQAASSIAESAQSAAGSSQKATAFSRQGHELAENLLARMRAIQASMAKSEQAIENLGRRSAKIGEIVNVITEIAEQTNLLSLNAAIEAARAGDSGRGFAVVADEIRKLAVGSAHSAQEIGGLIAEVQKETVLAVKASKSTTREVEDGGVAMLEADKGLQAILSSVESVSEQIAQIAAAAEACAKSTEEASARSGEHTAAIDEVSVSAQTLNGTVEELKSLVTKFKV